MSARRSKSLDRMLRLATTSEEQAKAAAAAEAAELRRAERAVEQAAASAGSLAGLPPGLTAHLVAAGSRHLHDLEQRRDDASTAALAARGAWQAARGRQQSMERLVERAQATQRAERLRAEQVEFGDLVASRMVADQ